MIWKISMMPGEPQENSSYLAPHKIDQTGVIIYAGLYQVNTYGYPPRNDAQQG